MRALEPGSTERIRVAVDFDGIDADNDQLFNLTLQRVDPDTRLVTDQEMFRRVDYRHDTERFVADVLLTSSLARVEQPYPAHRPEATFGMDTSFEPAYTEHSQPGSDGQELSDYDLIGSKIRGTGIFALDQVLQIDLLYLPPPGKGRDPGPAPLLAAERYCRHRGAMLIVDPPVEWVTPAKAVAGIRAMGLASPSMLGYFPRMYRRHEENDAPRAVGGAAVQTRQDLWALAGA